MADRFRPFGTGSCFRTARRGVASALLLVSVSLAALSDPRPQRASDTGYGMALFEYHQGNFFEALTRLNKANAKGGINGHGDHPLLVEGGLMLGYGMTREARRLFQNLLDEADVAPETRNQAWFYLGKVFWLENDAGASTDALGRVDGELLEDTDQALYHEWLYLRGQWLLARNDPSQTGEPLSRLIDELPRRAPWRWYLIYNRAVQLLADGDAGGAISDLSQLIDQAPAADDLPREIAEEFQALEHQARLSLGRLHLGQGEPEKAMAVLDDIPLDGMLSDQALFDYAVAASRQGQNAIALQSLETLQGRPLFTPWLQQVPYARAFTLEQMGQPEAALAAYRSAAEHYQGLDQRLSAEQAGLNERRLIEALSFVREGDSDLPPESQGAIGQKSAEPSLGEAAVLIDSYGRVQVRPRDFSLAELLAEEAFQLALRDLHELYRLERSLAQWRDQLMSFDAMLDTRRSRREIRIRETREALANLNADQWIGQQADFRRRIEQATAEQDAAFFMTDEQRALKQQLDEVEANLATLPDDDSTRKQRRTYQRMRAYFNWWVADDFSVNRWAAVKQLRELDDVMDTFISQRQLMEQEMASDTRLDEFAGRIEVKAQELDQVEAMLEAVLDQTRQKLMALVKTELTSQRREIAGYLRASRHAQARLADQLFQNDREFGPVEPAGTGLEGADE